MKKFFVSTGLVAIGAAGLQSSFAQGLDLVSPKAWNVSATLRGFYDDNYSTSASGGKKGSGGAEFSPSISYNLPLQQTDMGFRYIYGLYYYEDRSSRHVDPFDQSHQFEVWLDHAINERWKLNITDSVRMGQEPELLQPNQAAGAFPFRVNGNNLSNHANVSLSTQWTRLFSTALHYGNDFYDYQNHGATVVPGGIFSSLALFPVTTPGGMGFQSLSGSGPSLSGLLDRIEQNAGLDLQWTLSPETMIFVGYDFSWVNYIGNEPIAVFNYFDTTFSARSLVYNSNSRDSRTHEGHVGLSHQLTSNINTMLSVGAAYTDSYNDPLNHTTSISPSANASISYTYSPGSYVQLGITHGENSTDVVQPGLNGSITQYQHSTVVYGDLNHRITEKLMGTLIGRVSYSTFEGGAASTSGADVDYNVGVNLNYQITRHFSGEVGYNFDDLVSGLNSRGFVRNRVYLGLSANY